jgi:hypothetical protein
MRAARTGLSRSFQVMPDPSRVHVAQDIWADVVDLALQVTGQRFSAERPVQLQLFQGDLTSSKFTNDKPSLPTPNY